MVPPTDGESAGLFCRWRNVIALRIGEFGPCHWMGHVH